MASCSHPTPKKLVQVLQTVAKLGWVRGAWPFLVGGTICLVNSDNEREISSLLNHRLHCVGVDFLEGQVAWLSATRD